MIQFVFGALIGAAAAWYWRQDIENTMPNLRTKAADRLQSIEKTAEGMLDKAKSGVVTRMRACEERLRGAQEQAGGGGRMGTTGTQTQGGYGGVTGGGSSTQGGGGSVGRPQS